MQNFIEYATEYAKNTSDTNYQKLKKITEKIKDAESAQEIYTTLFEELQKDKSILLFLQKVFETPIY
jgi:nitrate reductase assembly molybdenum cofactor insertion protein NarJ